MNTCNLANKRFLYRANALGLAGRFGTPTPEIFPVQAAAVLPIMGGSVEGRVENFTHGDEYRVSCAAAQSNVSGMCGATNCKPTFDTVATSVVEKFDLLGIVSAEQIEGRISSHYPANGGEVSMIPGDSQFVGLRVAGHLITMDTNVELFRTLDTFSALESEYRLNTGFAEMARREFHWGGGAENAPEHIVAAYGWMKGCTPGQLPESNGFVITSIFKNIKCEDPTVKVDGFVLDVPDFGKIYLGEYFIGRQTRRLTMLRAEVEYPFHGGLVAAALEGDGTTFP